MEDTRIVEIGGVKIECDLRSARQVDTFKVGDPVKVLVKEYSDFKIKYGVIVDFANFKELPSIVVAYLDGWSGDDIKFAHVNAKSDGIEIAPASTDELRIDGKGITSRINAEIANKEREIEDLRRKLEVFEKRFSHIFGDINKG